MARIWGKLLGGMLGFAVGGNPLGALFGAVIGHAYDQRGGTDGLPWIKLTPRRKAFGGEGKFSIFNSGIIALGAKVAKSDGQVTRAKIDVFKQVFYVKPEDEARVGRIFDTARRSAEDFEPHAFTVAQIYCNSPAALEEILLGLMRIAAADDQRISPASVDILKSIAFTFNFSPDIVIRLAGNAGLLMPNAEEIAAARREVKRDLSSDPYLVLGINSQATNKEIKNAYRTLIRKHHPDQMIAKGMSPELIAVANEKMKRLNAAYDFLSKDRGIK